MLVNNNGKSQHLKNDEKMLKIEKSIFPFLFVFGSYHWSSPSFPPPPLLGYMFEQGGGGRYLIS